MYSCSKPLDSPLGKDVGELPHHIGFSYSLSIPRFSSAPAADFFFARVPLRRGFLEIVSIFSAKHGPRQVFGRPTSVPFVFVLLKAFFSSGFCSSIDWFFFRSFAGLDFSFRASPLPIFSPTTARRSFIVFCRSRGEGFLHQNVWYCVFLRGPPFVVLSQLGGHLPPLTLTLRRVARLHEGCSSCQELMFGSGTNPPLTSSINLFPALVLCPPFPSIGRCPARLHHDVRELNHASFPQKQISFFDLVVPLPSFF